VADNHAKHSRESHRLAQERAAQLTPGSPAWDRHVAAHGEPEPAPEALANLGLWADSGGMHDD
jgi:hypothetical protein